MEALIILIVISIIVIVIISAVTRASKLNDIADKLRSVENKLNSINEKIQKLHIDASLRKQEKPVQEATKPIEKPIPEHPKEVIKPAYVHPEVIETPKPKQEVAQAAFTPAKTFPPIEIAKPKQSWMEKWLQDNPDMEKFIGENLANKIGIAVLVFGIGFFVKYAIDKDWINEVGRVSIGLLAGGILLGLAHRLKNKFRSFSSVLVAGGLTVLYFVISLAFHQYHLFSQTVAFVIMIIITVFAVVLSLLYNRIELAILATIGGYVAPFLVSTGQNNYVSLFTYLIILNFGLLVLSYFKKWQVVHYIAVFFTTIIFGGWLINQAVKYDQIPYTAAIFFASAFYVQFVVMAIIHKLKSGELFSKLDFSLLLSINVLYYTAMMIVLADLNGGNYRGVFTIILAVVNFLLAWTFFKRFKADKNFVYLLIGLTLTYVSLTAPVQLKGNYITLFWAAETVLLFWLYQRSGIKLMKLASLLVFVALLFSLVIDWGQLYFIGSEKRIIVFNKAYLTSVFVSGALFLYYRLLYIEADSFYLKGISNKFLRNFLLATGILTLYLSGLFEMNYQFKTSEPIGNAFAPYSFFYTAIFAAIAVLSLKKISKLNTVLLTLISGFAFIFYCVNINSTHSLFVNDIILKEKSTLPIAAHWVGVLLLFWLMYTTVQSIRRLHSSFIVATTYLVAVAYLLVIGFSLRYPWLLLNNAQKDDLSFYVNLYQKAVITISWGLSSFFMMWLGLKNSFKSLRWCSIILFGITLIKLFLYDIRNIPPGGKIAAFILLGVLLLIISFMYQRLKKLIIDDEKEES